MPSLRPCTICGTLARGSRCPNHPSGWAGYRGKPLPPNWSKLRAQVLAEEPWCRSCRKAPSTEVDHILNRARGGTHDRSNLTGLCSPCHRAKTQGESHHR